MTAEIGYLIRVDLKKQLGAAAEDTKSFFVLPPADCKLSHAEAREKAFAILASAMPDISRHPVMEEAAQRRVSVLDLRPLRNSLLLETEGWRCFRVVT